MERSDTLRSVGQSWSDESSVASVVHDPDAELRMTAVHNPPYFSIYPQANGSYSYDGYIYELWQILARQLGLRYRVVPLISGGFGSLDENGTWTGMVGELAYGRADFALTWINIRQDRAAVIDYIDDVPIDKLEYEFFIPRGSGDIPQISPSMLSSLLKPLGTNVWWMLLASVFVLSVVLRLTIRFSHRQSERRQTVHEMTWGSCLLFSFMTIIGQGWAVTPNSMAARTLTMSSWFLGIMIYASYTANLISHLTVVTVDRPISSLKEFSEQSDWTFAIEPGHGHLNDWKLGQDAYKRQLFWRSVSREGYVDLKPTPEAIRSISQPRVMTYITFSWLSSALKKDACNLVTLNDDLPPNVSNGYMAIAKGRDTLRQAINQLMYQMHQTGLLQRLKNKWVTSSTVTCESSSSSRAFSFGEFLPVFTIVPLAVIFSVVILAIEAVASRCATKRANRVAILEAELAKKNDKC